FEAKVADAIDERLAAKRRGDVDRTDAQRAGPGLRDRRWLRRIEQERLPHRRLARERRAAGEQHANQKWGQRRLSRAPQKWSRRRLFLVPRNVREQPPKVVSDPIFHLAGSSGRGGAPNSRFDG